LQAVLTKLEHDLASKPEESPDLSKWIQAVNSLSGLAKTLGVEKKLTNVWHNAEATVAVGSTEEATP
jgi:hypothetical protein